MTNPLQQLADALEAGREFDRCMQRVDAVMRDKRSAMEIAGLAGVASAWPATALGGSPFPNTLGNPGMGGTGLEPVPPSFSTVEHGDSGERNGAHVESAVPVNKPTSGVHGYSPCSTVTHGPSGPVWPGRGQESLPTQASVAT